MDIYNKGKLLLFLKTINQTGVMNASVLSKLEAMLCGLEEIIKDDVDCLVITTDGLWDVVSNDEAVSLVKSIENPEAAARKLTETAFNKGSADNITYVVRFNHGKDDSP
ncbi:probable protein phosphatase 2C member 13, mitochondrial isoform X2 [Cryptomeria japonica]|nr:probable protein phosphatase 2C member 13, mitochondrial isoform X2 [Cryptomeria japonica]